MENETLFAEEAEPPGGLTGLLDLKKQTDSFFSSYSIQPPSPVVRANVSRVTPRIQDSPGSLAFRKRFFPDTADEEWQDWHWQVRNRIRDAQALLLCELSQQLDVVGIADAQDVPPITQEPGRNVFREGDAGVPLNGDMVVVVDPTEVVQAQMAGE